MSRQPLVWVGAPEGTAFRSRPLMLAFEQRCIFRDRVQAALNEAYIPWEMATETHQTRTVEAVVSADLAVHAMIKGSVPPQTQEIDHRGALPPLGDVGINLYAQSKSGKAGLADLSNMIREAYSQEGTPNVRRGPQLVAS